MIRALLKKFLHSQRGSAMPIVALGMTMLIASTGVAVDMGRVQIVQSRMQNALDSAGLAAGATLNTTDPTSIVKQYFYANFPANYLGTQISSLTVTSSSDNMTLLLNVQGTVNTTFLQIFHMPTIAVQASSQITRQSSGMELVLVMDNTGSMNQSAGGTTTKIAAAKIAANALLDIIYGSDNTVKNLWVGLVPFSQAVNIGTSRTAWLDSTYDTTLNFGPYVPGTSCPTYSGTAGSYAAGPKCSYTTASSAVPNFAQVNWGGCVEARSNGTASPQYDITDDTPSTKPFRMYLWPDDSTDNWYTSTGNQTCTGHGSHKTCSITSTTTQFDYSNSASLGDNLGPNSECPQPLTPMVAEKSTVTTAINAMTAQGDTHIDLGLAWAWRMLSPKWRGLWGGEMDPNSLPLDYNTPLMNKVVVLMTDGDNTISNGLYTAYGYPTSNQLGSNECPSSSCTNGINQLNARTTAVCNSMKAQGILIYTIALGSSVSSTGQSLLQNCATKPAYYFLSPTTNELQNIFQQIGDSLANLRVSQ